MKLTSYPCPLPGGAAASELALTFDAGRAKRVLIAPALFDEAHKLRRFTVEVMRRLDGAGIDSILPDLPGCNESEQDLALIEPEDWRMALEAAARHFGATYVLALGGLLEKASRPVRIPIYLADALFLPTEVKTSLLNGSGDRTYDPSSVRNGSRSLSRSRAKS